MKGVILSICPDAHLVDLSHEVAPFHTEEGAFVVSQAVPFFPEGTVHLVVVDPGVGSARRALVARGRRALYVGPDNGVLGPLLALDGPATVHAIGTPDFLPAGRSATFHGRDVFAPAAAYLALGRPLEAFGPKLDENLSRPFAAPAETAAGWTGAVLHVDRFGNLITNLPNALAERLSAVEVAGRHLDLVPSYSGVERGRPGAVAGSVERIEVFVREGSARDLLGAAVGTPVVGRRRP
jgi:S-adenosyl-L-methionine hydrolase (adenosine-forming)